MKTIAKSKENPSIDTTNGIEKAPAAAEIAVIPDIEMVRKRLKRQEHRKMQ
ncbi:Variable outer membrane protein [Borrelia duttonii CR2A]|uniref:Variable outer membrane protein n=1 Tax=Borrelia duttonii CR2A TaxID=1432657 RepID=W6TFV2_9SPIR|nr:Variable outer membrane protein [Borrelia duttonii CR2A]